MSTSSLHPHTEALATLKPARPGYSPLTLWHLLSLDAPTVASVWVLFVAWCAGLPWPAADAFAMFLAVWILYVVDRLLDAKPLRGAAYQRELRERHRFHLRHRGLFLGGVALASAPLLAVLRTMPRGTLALYVVLGGLLALWLGVVHAASLSGRRAHRLPKELAVGLFFPAAVFLPTVSRLPHLRGPLLPFAVLFGGVCSLNCLFLHAWEHPRASMEAHSTTRWGLAYLAPLSWTLTGVGSTIAALLLWVPRGSSLPHSAAIPLASALCSALLLQIHRNRARFSRVMMRSLADAILLTPVPIVLWVHLWSRAHL